jgi:hypothetical protein
MKSFKIKIHSKTLKKTKSKILKHIQNPRLSAEYLWLTSTQNAAKLQPDFRPCTTRRNEDAVQYWGAKQQRWRYSVIITYVITLRDFEEMVRKLIKPFIVTTE